MGKELFVKIPKALVFVFLICVAFTTTKVERLAPELKYSLQEVSLAYDVAMSTPAVEPTKPPFLGKSFNGFKEALAYRESRGNYFVVNSYGYMGKYQFGAATLRSMGIDDAESFLNDPVLQEKVFVANLERNKYVLRKEIAAYEGKTVNGVLVTESGILAAAHLAGPANVKRFLYSSGAEGFEDANGTSIRFYMRKFQGYDMSSLKVRKKVRMM